MCLLGLTFVVACHIARDILGKGERVRGDVLRWNTRKNEKHGGCSRLKGC